MFDIMNNTDVKHQFLVLIGSIYRDSLQQRFSAPIIAKSDIQMNVSFDKHGLIQK